MAKKKLTRKELLKSPDEFMTFSSRVAVFFNKHQDQLRYAGIAIAVVAIVYLVGYAYLRHVNQKGQEAYNKAYYELTQNLRPDATQIALERSEELFQAVMDDYGLSKAARLAQPHIAFVKFLEKNYDEAITFYQTFLDDVSGEMYLESMSALALAACYEAKGDLKTAIETLSPILDRPNDPFREAAMLSLARLFRIDNQTEKAKETLKEFVETYKESPFLPMAKAHL